MKDIYIYIYIVEYMGTMNAYFVGDDHEEETHSRHLCRRIDFEAMDKCITSRQNDGSCG
jgi:hypothetical protein